MLFRYIATFLSHTILVVCICVYYHFVLAENEEQTMEQMEQMETSVSPSPPPSKDSLEMLHHKVPLVDILFSDGSKRTCTGAIIHEYVVITAGHCFMTLPGGREVEAEITGSFVIIGSKKKFENGYEQYLPIEKVLIHPRYKEWSCDLALIYTFSSMDKIGDTLPLATEKIAINQEPNVTILSWSPYLEIEDVEEPICCIDNSCTPDEDIDKCHATTHKHIISEEREERDPGSGEQEQRAEDDEKLHDHKKNKHKAPVDRSNDWSYLRKSAYRKTTQPGRFETVRSADKATGNEEGFSPKRDMLVTVMDRAYFGKFRRFVYRQQLRKVNSMVHPVPEGVVRTTDMDTSWWRRMESKPENKLPVLSVESFGFINMATCKKMIAKSKPHVVMEDNEMVCFTSDDHFVTDSDSGAPIVREGQLLGITVGGTGTSADHIVVAMKLNYFCMWINQNLPPGSHLLHCWDETQVMNAMRIVSAKAASKQT